MGKEQDGTSGDQGGDESLRTSSGQRDLAGLLEAGRVVGNNSPEYEIWSSYTIRMGSSLAEYLRTLGGGEISQGVVIAGQFHQAMGRQNK